MAKDSIPGIICLKAKKLLDNSEDPFCVNHWVDMTNKGVTEDDCREDCLVRNGIFSIDEIVKLRNLADLLEPMDDPGHPIAEKLDREKISDQGWPGADDFLDPDGLADAKQQDELEDYDNEPE
jgi:hypothetical protein